MRGDVCMKDKSCNLTDLLMTPNSSSTTDSGFRDSKETTHESEPSERKEIWSSDKSTTQPRPDGKTIAAMGSNPSVGSRGSAASSRRLSSWATAHPLSTHISGLERQAQRVTWRTSRHCLGQSNPRETSDVQFRDATLGTFTRYGQLAKLAIQLPLIVDVLPVVFTFRMELSVAKIFKFSHLVYPAPTGLVQRCRRMILPRFYVFWLWNDLNTPFPTVLRKSKTHRCQFIFSRKEPTHQIPRFTR